MTLACANNRDLLFCLKPIKKHMSKTASVLDTGTSGSTPVGYHDLPWPSAASGTPGLLEPASASIAGRNVLLLSLPSATPETRQQAMVLFRKLTQTNMTLGRASNREWLFFLKPIKKLMGKTAVLDTGTSGSTPVGYHDLPWPSAASGTPGLLEPATALA